MAPFEQLALQGYDHILDIEDESGKSILDVATERQNDALVDFLNSLRTLEEAREELHQVIRDKDLTQLKVLTAMPNAKWLIKTKNYYGKWISTRVDMPLTTYFISLQVALLYT